MLASISTRRRRARSHDASITEARRAASIARTRLAEVRAQRDRVNLAVEQVVRRAAAYGFPTTEEA